jgi:Cft2 family RNA processing exonuclease
MSHSGRMDLTFLGGATTVTGSQYLLTTERARILIDCGMFQGMPNESIRNRIPPEYDPKTLDAVLLTHAHLDHCGLLPLLVKQGFGGPILTTMGTIELATLVLLDSGRLHEEFAKREARWEKRHPDLVAADDAKEAQQYQAALDLAQQGDTIGVPGASPAPPAGLAFPVPPPGSIATGEHVATVIEPLLPPDATIPDPEADLRAKPPPLVVDLDAPLYTEADAAAVLPKFKPIDYGQELEVAPGVYATFHDAGHILGSAIIRLRVQDRADSPERVIVFSGDLGRENAPIVRDPTVETSADYVLCESTYGGREHDSQDEAVRILAETVQMVADAKGVLLVPSFAIGRTQEVVWQLDRLLEEGRIPMLPLFLDSPMASKATDVYRRHNEYYDDETRKLFQSGATPLDYPKQTVTNDIKQSQAILGSPRPFMIVASNGMLTGGRVVGHLRMLIDDPLATILFVGYQGTGTLGAHLQQGATTVKLDGQVRQVRCKIRSISGFSSHADEPGLLAWLGNFGRGASPAADSSSATGAAPTPAGVAPAAATGAAPTPPDTSAIRNPHTIFLIHGDPEAQLALAPKVEALGFKVRIPHWHERVTLD